MKKWANSFWRFFFKQTNFNSIVSPEVSSVEKGKQHWIELVNLVFHFLMILIALGGFLYAIREFIAARKEFIEGLAIAREQMKQERDQFSRQMRQAREEYTFAIHQFQYQRKKDSLQSIEDEKKFQENLQLSQKQVKALRAITDYNLSAQKPFFQSEFKVGFTNASDNSNHVVLYTKLKNAGIRPATDLWVHLILVDRSLKQINKEIKFSSQNGIPSNQDYLHGEYIDLIKGVSFSSTRPFYLYAMICYSDPLLGEQIQQKFYYSWTYRMRDTLESPVTPASSSEVETIELFLKKNNSVTNCTH
jgi:hypothetical protein